MGTDQSRPHHRAPHQGGLRLTPGTAGRPGGDSEDPQGSLAAGPVALCPWAGRMVLPGVRRLARRGGATSGRS
ncbi:hypothetical protein SCOCK_370003 [Actinacidiphila cocklensis]|uniref:Uncharacterized protein n=1 Tax=Actinacidiphila cocklensis TaxID=887465 RepID=A0A9W4DXU2_9ACTN|nr:hypothetical protein SCOCK_370003 [Actinacidiphila cocklensis]